MPSRPQFSLRMLLFAMLLVCLAAATAAPLQPPRPLRIPTPGGAEIRERGLRFLRLAASARHARAEE